VIRARLEPEDRDPKQLIKNKCLEKLNDFDYNGKKVLASRLGYRITENFAFRCMNRLFDEPLAVFNERMLKPELQSMEDYVDGINNIVEAQQNVALQYFKDGSIEAAIPPLKILLHIMAYGQYEGKEISDPELRKYFNREYVLESDWYKNRLKMKQEKDITFYRKQIAYLKKFHAETENKIIGMEINIAEKIVKAEELMRKVQSPEYLNELVGTIGADPLFVK
jgi:hypothetical protein